MSTQNVPKPKSRKLRLIALCLSVFLVGGATAWALITVLRPAADPAETVAHTYVAVTRGEVEASIRLSTVAEWTTTPVGVNRATGIVTKVNTSPGDEVVQGTTLYTVNLRPVVIAQGQTPAFRPLGSGATGPDVEQLQSLLSALGHYTGAVTGTVDAATVRAIRAWQKALDVEDTGTVGAEDIIFVPQLPTRITLDPQIVSRGVSLVGGEEVVLGLPVTPTFVISVTDAQAAMIPTGARVEITSPDSATWVGVTADHVTDPNTGFINVQLTSADDLPICQDACGAVPVTGRAILTSNIVTVEKTSGLMVPSAAIASEASGHLVVITESGERIPVELVASAKGISIITGVSEGLRVKVPA